MTAAILADFKTVPYLHQLKEFEISADMKARAWLWRMRTGKTKIGIDTACHLYSGGHIDAVLVFAPNGVHENWIRRELPAHHWDTVPRSDIYWDTDTAGKKGKTRVKAADRADWQNGHDLWWAVAKDMLAYKDRLVWFSFAAETMTRPDVRRLISRIAKSRRVLVLFDESDDYRTPGSTRAKMARAVSRHCDYSRILSGSLVHNSPLHAWSQFELLEPGALGFSTYTEFKDHYAVYEMKRRRKGKSYPALKEYQNLDELQERMAPWCSVVSRKDCADLPPIIHRTRSIVLSEEQVELYRELHSKFEFEIDNETVTINENASRLMKLQQVVSGFMIDEYGDTHILPGVNPKLEALSDEVYLSSGKIIVWCQFQRDIDVAVKRLTADGHKIVQYHGRVNSSDKRLALKAFQDDPDVKCMVGQAQSAGRGLDWSEAGEIIWFSHTFDAIIRDQADERATAICGGNVQMVDLISPGVEEYIRETVELKLELAERLAGDGMREILERIKI